MEEFNFLWRGIPYREASSPLKDGKCSTVAEELQRAQPTPLRWGESLLSTGGGRMVAQEQMSDREKGKNRFALWGVARCDKCIWGEENRGRSNLSRSEDVFRVWKSNPGRGVVFEDTTAFLGKFLLLISPALIARKDWLAIRSANNHDS